MRAHEDYKKENYAIAIHTIGGSTRPDALSSTSGHQLMLVSGSDTIGSVSVFGIRASSTKISFEVITVANTSGNLTSSTDWNSVYGMRMSDIYGIAMSTQSADLSLVSVANTSHELANISSGGKSIKAQLYSLTGQNITLHDISGNVWYKPSAVLPTSNNAFRMTDGMIRDMRITPESPFLMLDSDTGGSSVQIAVQQD